MECALTFSRVGGNSGLATGAHPTTPATNASCTSRSSSQCLLPTSGEPEPRPWRRHQPRRLLTADLRAENRGAILAWHCQSSHTQPRGTAIGDGVHRYRAYKSTPQGIKCPIKQSYRHTRRLQESETCPLYAPKILVDTTAKSGYSKRYRKHN